MGDIPFARTEPSGADMFCYEKMLVLRQHFFSMRLSIAVKVI